MLLLLTWRAIVHVKQTTPTPMPRDVRCINIYKNTAVFDSFTYRELANKNNVVTRCSDYVIATVR